jgi:hypothetical protein
VLATSSSAVAAAPDVAASDACCISHIDEGFALNGQIFAENTWQRDAELLEQAVPDL